MADYLAYVLVRMPATEAVLKRVFQEIAKRAACPIETILDLGSGPGTAYHAAASIWPLKRFIAVERDPQFIALGRELAPAIEWRESFLESYAFDEPADLIVFSYSIAEIEDYRELIDKALLRAPYVAVIEPGTPKGFERILSIRQQMIESKRALLAPCPGTFCCPMSGPKWCHFSERLSRSQLHKEIKQASLGFEDEKFSYVVAGEGAMPEARLVDSPRHRSGHSLLSLCHEGALEVKTISRRQGAFYKMAKRLEWGDAIETFHPEPEESHEEGNS